VLVLTDGSRLEMRSVPNFREVETYILDRINVRPAAGEDADNKGFAA